MTAKPAERPIGWSYPFLDSLFRVHRLNRPTNSIRKTAFRIVNKHRSIQYDIPFVYPNIETAALKVNEGSGGERKTFSDEK
jgi:hypothetical protein